LGCLRTLGEECSISLDQLACHGSRSQLDKSITAVALVGANSNLLDLVDSHLRCPPQTLDDNLRADTLLNVLLNLFQDLAGEDND
jgi:hypothetical protein